MELSLQQMFMIAVDTCLVIMLVIDFILLVKSSKRSKNDIGYEIAKMELEFKKDLHFIESLGKLSDRIEVLEKLHDIDDSKEDKKDE